MNSTYNINAGWEQRESDHILRHFIAWNDDENGKISGSVAGYIGGGEFLIEPFYATYNNGELTSLIFDLYDSISKQEVSFIEVVPMVNQIISENTFDLLWDWNNKDIWEEEDRLILLEDKVPLLKKVEDLLILNNNTNPFLPQICEYVGLLSKPKI